MTPPRSGNGAAGPVPPRKPPTIFDVAAEAGVSKSTVSNVVRGVQEVSDGTRARVLEAIERLDYKPNAIARQFVQQRTTMLGVLLGDLSNPYYAQMAQVVERAAFGYGYTTMFCNIEGAEEIAVSGVDALLGHRVAGIVFLAFVARRSHVNDSLQRAGVPIVFLGLSEAWGDSVGPRDTEGGRLATDHLLELGHRRIAYVRTPLVERSGDRARYSGYRSAMTRGGLEALPAHVWEPGAGEMTIGRQSVSLEQAISGPGAPTALFASNDIGAIALIEACETAGLSVPGDISVVGFDDIALAGLHRISLTTVAQPLHFQAERAVSLLLERIENPSIAPRHVRVPVKLCVRDSTVAISPGR
ncbi:MAG TPA: LacI family DNA-binding transcriptional regulator [Solirubrobacteraceae bacterium]|jgi:LacI family transcriptional regulator|nr:LacI family DNA-binding transcriptional regulator [Solirubrobacteraceae bacterium]